MIYKMISDRIINNVASNFNLDMEYRDIYAYSLERYLSNMFNFIIFSIAAIVFRIPAETIVFAIFYGPLRKYAGGIHVKSRSLCLVLSLAIMIAIIRLSKILVLLPYWRVITAIMLVIACCLIFILAPVDSSRRRLSVETARLYKRRSRWIIGLESISLTIGILWFNILSSFIILGALAILLEGIFLIPNHSES